MNQSYVKDYLKLNCSGQLQELFSKSHNPFKEITESMSAWVNMKEFINPKDENWNYVFIGDGSLCLTGALYSFLSKSKSYSIDPLINKERITDWVNMEKVKNFNWYKEKYQEFKNASISCDLILVHAHVNLKEVIQYFPNWRYLYTNPCCNIYDQTFSLQFQEENNITCMKSGFDNNIISSKNLIFVYYNKLFGEKK